MQRPASLAICSIAFLALLAVGCGGDKPLVEDAASPPARKFPAKGGQAGWGKATGEDFHGCPPQGRTTGNQNLFDPDLNLMKNRDGELGTVFESSLASVIADVRPVARTMVSAMRRHWSDAALLDLAMREQTAVRVAGRVVALELNGPESCNCESDSDRTYTVWIGPAADSPKSACVVAAITPRMMNQHAAWTKERIEALGHGAPEIRVCGWLLWNGASHYEVGKTRAIEWELHPIGAIELKEGETWVPFEAKSAGG